MRLTKYQKARLLEFEWDIIGSENSDDNTFWIQIDSEDGNVLSRVQKLLDLPDTIDNVKLLVVATHTENK